MPYGYARYNDEDLWAEVRHTKVAIRARCSLFLYTALVSVPFVALCALAAYFCGLMPHEITGVSCYNAMVTSLFFFDTIRNAAHLCFDEAREQGWVTVRDGIPIIDPAYRHRRLARLSFAIGGRMSDWT